MKIRIRDFDDLMIIGNLWMVARTRTSKLIREERNYDVCDRSYAGVQDVNVLKVIENLCPVVV